MMHPRTLVSKVKKSRPVRDENDLGHLVMFKLVEALEQSFL